MNDNIMLPINLRKEAHLTFHLVILLREDLYPWFYENFINIHIHGTQNVAMEFLDNRDDAFKFLIDEQITYSFEELKQMNLIGVVIKNLKKRFYTALWTDKFYIPGAIEFHHHHFVHPIFVYGYNEESQHFLFVNFSMDKGIVTNEISCEDLKQAVCEVGTYYPNGGGSAALEGTMICIRERGDYDRSPFHLTAFREELQNYVFSRPGEIRGRQQWRETEDTRYGLQVYDVFLSLMENMNESLYIPFKIFSDFVTHKQYLHDRLKYIGEIYRMPDLYYACMEKINQVAVLMKRLKLLCMKYSMIDYQNPVFFSMNPAFIEKCVQGLRQAKRLEEEALIPICTMLNEAIPVKADSFCGKQLSGCQKILRDTLQIVFEREEIITSVEIETRSDSRIMLPISCISFDDDEHFFLPEIPAPSPRAYVREFLPRAAKSLEFRFCSPVNIAEDTVSLTIRGLYDQRIWDFRQGLSLDWKPVNDITNTCFGNVWSFSIIGKDANILCTRCSIDPCNAKYIYIRYKIIGYSAVGQVFFNTINAPQLSEKRSKIFTVSPNDTMQEYIIDMSDCPEWKDGITAVRIDPTGYDVGEDQNVTCEIESIEISGRLPIYSSLNCYGYNQGINGWYYYVYNNGTSYREMSYEKETSVWAYPNCPGITLSADRQNSFNHLATVRRWICQSSGIYSVKLRIYPETDNIKGMFTIRRNHKSILQYELYRGTTEDCFEIELEYGESLNFIYYNENELTVEKIQISIEITKENKREKEIY